MDYTINELAKKCGATAPGVRYVIKSKGFEDRIIKDRKPFLVPEDVAEEVIRHFTWASEKPYFSVEKQEEILKEFHEQVEGNPALVEELKALIEEQKETISKQTDIIQEQNRLNIELAETNKALVETNRQLVESNKALTATNAVQVITDKKEALLVEPVEEKQEKQEEKLSWWKRIFK